MVCYYNSLPVSTLIDIKLLIESCKHLKKRCIMKADISGKFTGRSPVKARYLVFHLSLSHTEIAWAYPLENKLNFLPLSKFIGEINISTWPLKPPELGSISYSLISNITFWLNEHIHHWWIRSHHWLHLKAFLPSLPSQFSFPQVYWSAIDI